MAARPWKEIVVELKNDLTIKGQLHSVDQYLNIKLDNVTIDEPDVHPYLLSIGKCFIRGSVVRYVQIPHDAVDRALLQDATRRESEISKK